MSAELINWPVPRLDFANPYQPGEMFLVSPEQAHIFKKSYDLIEIVECTLVLTGDMRKKDYATPVYRATILDEYGNEPTTRWWSARTRHVYDMTGPGFAMAFTKGAETTSNLLKSNVSHIKSRIAGLDLRVLSLSCMIFDPMKQDSYWGVIHKVVPSDTPIWDIRENK